MQSCPPFLLFWCYIKINHLFTLKNLASHFDLSLASMNIRLEREAYNAKKNCISRRFRGKHVRKIAKDVCKSSHNIKRACIKIKPPKCHSILTTSICYYYLWCFHNQYLYNVINSFHLHSASVLQKSLAFWWLQVNFAFLNITLSL